MRKLLFALLICRAIVNTNSFSQSYIPFPEDSASWAVHQWFANTVDPGSTYYYYFWDRYYSGGDTIINTNNYNILLGDTKGYVDTVVGGPIVGTIASTHTVMFYRNDIPNKKVYAIYPDSAAEFLWYDFDLHVGDSIFIDYGSPYPVAITSIDQISICGLLRTRYNYESPWGYNENACLIEGVGNMSDFKNNWRNLNEHSASQVDCFVDFNYCSAGTTLCNVEVGIENEYTKVTLQVFPNPVVNFIHTSEVYEQLRIYDMSGKLVLQKNNSDQINTYLLQPGIYILAAEKNGRYAHARFIKQ